ncbi:unnamed protein product [Gordionus sp. m RMFG-2023]|uniref:uncharacterized protein LOC135931207 n=1 Tax=Gordionus sp. m RMFG-2023 TaxID=3053472 RepID=UPI0030DEAC93
MLKHKVFYSRLHSAPPLSSIPSLLISLTVRIVSLPLFVVRRTYTSCSNFYDTLLKSPLLGIFLGICQCICTAFASLLIARVRTVNPLQIANIRMIVQLLLTLPALIFYSTELIPYRNTHHRKLLFPLYIRCIAGTVGITCLTFALVYAPISDASTISYTSPVYVAILARIFLGERIAVADAGLLALALTGVVFVTRPAFLFRGSGKNGLDDLNVVVSPMYNQQNLNGLKDPSHLIDLDNMDHGNMARIKGFIDDKYSYPNNFSSLYNNNHSKPYNINDNNINFFNQKRAAPRTEAVVREYPKRVLGLIFAAISSVLTAVAMVTIRKINKLPFSTVIVNFSAVGVIGTASLCAILGHYSLPDCLPSNYYAGRNFMGIREFGPFSYERYFILGSAFLGTLGQLFLFLALRIENAGVIAAVNSLTIVFTILLQIVFQRKIPPWTSFLGSVIIIIAICLFGYRKWVKEKAKAEERLRKLSFERKGSTTHSHHSMETAGTPKRLPSIDVTDSAYNTIFKIADERTPLSITAQFEIEEEENANRVDCVEDLVDSCSNNLSRSKSFGLFPPEKPDEQQLSTNTVIVAHL